MLTSRVSVPGMESVIFVEHHIYDPATNGLAERAMQTFKQGLKKLTEGSLETRLAHFLFSY